jgi:hypothetical protein
MPICKLCSSDVHASRLTGDQICFDCAEKHGLPPRSEPLRPRRPCDRCNHTTFVRCHALRERAAEGHDYVTQYLAPLSATYATKVDHTFWAGRKVTSADPKLPVGVFEAYICQRCGFTELYARDAARIPIGPEFGTELFDTASDTPYR